MDRSITTLVEPFRKVLTPTEVCDISIDRNGMNPVMGQCRRNAEMRVRAESMAVQRQSAVLRYFDWGMNSRTSPFEFRWDSICLTKLKTSP